MYIGSTRFKQASIQEHVIKALIEARLNPALINLVMTFLPPVISREKAIENDTSEHPFKLVIDELKKSEWSCLKFRDNLGLLQYSPIPQSLCKTNRINFRTHPINPDNAYTVPSNKTYCICAQCGNFQVGNFNQLKRKMLIISPPLTWSEDRRKYRIDLIKRIYPYDFYGGDNYYCTKRSMAHPNASCKCGFDID